MSDPYSVLGLSSSASMDEVKSAYRRLAKKYHPDLNPGDAAAAKKMNEINAAYTSIKDGTADQYNNPYASASASHASQAYNGFYGQQQGQQQYYDPFGFGGFRPVYRKVNPLSFIITIIVFYFLLSMFSSFGRSSYYNSYYSQYGPGYYNSQYDTTQSDQNQTDTTTDNSSFPGTGETKQG